MKSTFSYLSSTIGRKQVVGLTGILLSLFLLTHMLANLLIIFSADKYNVYSHNLISNPLIYLAEAGLLGLFFVHLGTAIKLTLESKNARLETYAVAASGEKATGLIQKTMIHQGMVILIFTVYHLITFKYGPYYEVTVDGVVMRDLHRLVIEIFQRPVYVVGYLFALVILGLHLSHGLSSSLRTLGFNHPKYDCKVRAAGVAYAVLVMLGFISQPIYVFFIH